MQKPIIWSQRSAPPFRADLVGSFLRPPALLRARTQWKTGQLAQKTLHALENKEIRSLVKKEQEMGLSVVTDGEFRRSWWHLDFFELLNGVEKYELPDKRGESIRITAPLSFPQNHPMLGHFSFLKSIAGNCVPKYTIPSPALFHLIQSRQPSFIYPTETQLLEAVALLWQNAIQAFYQAGCRYLQLDDTTWGTLCSQPHRELLEKKGIDPETLAHTYANLLKESLRYKPDDMVIALHVCRGNLRSTGFASGGYEPIAPILFPSTPVDAFFLEFDNERSGNFKPLQYIGSQMAVLGLITTKHGGLEDPAWLRDRIEEATQYVDADRLCLSPQCGFASTAEGNLLSEEEQWEKIALLLSASREIWG